MSCPDVKKLAEEKISRRKYLKYAGAAVAAITIAGVEYSFYYPRPTSASPTTSPISSEAKPTVPIEPVKIDESIGTKINSGIFYSFLKALEDTDKILVRMARPVSNFFEPLNVENDIKSVRETASLVTSTFSPLIDALTSPKVDFASVYDLNSQANQKLIVGLAKLENAKGRIHPLIVEYNSSLSSAFAKYSGGNPFGEDILRAAAAIGSVVTISSDVDREADSYKESFSSRVEINKKLAKIIKEKMLVDLETSKQNLKEFPTFVAGPLLFNEYTYFRRISTRKNKVTGYIGKDEPTAISDARADIEMWLRFNSDQSLKNQYKSFNFRQLEELARLQKELGIDPLGKVSPNTLGIHRTLEEAFSKPQVHEMLKLNLNRDNVDPSVLAHTTRDSIFEYEWRTEERKSEDLLQNLEGKLMPLFKTVPDSKIYSTQTDVFKAFRKERRRIFPGTGERASVYPNFDYEYVANPALENRLNYFSAHSADVGHLDSHRKGYSEIEGSPAQHIWVAYWSKKLQTYCVRIGIFEKGNWYFFDPAFEEESGDWEPGYSTVPVTDGESILHVPAIYANDFPKLKVSNVPTEELYPRYIRCEKCDK